MIFLEYFMEKYSLLIFICYSMNEFPTTKICVIATFPIFWFRFLSLKPGKSYGISARKYRLVELMQQVQISDESLNHSWKTSKLLQEAMGHIGVFTGTTCFEDLTKSILNYLSSHCPEILERSFRISVIKHCHCTVCDTEDTYHEHELVINTIKPINSYVKSSTKSECRRYSGRIWHQLWQNYYC